jgi:phage tail sheath protein FI
VPTYLTPGAYIEREDRAQGGINRLRTDIAAFVGIAERGPARRAVAVESWKQFAAIFGSVFEHGYLAYVVRAFFENGGRRCWIVRVESDAAEIASAQLLEESAIPPGSPVWEIQASSSGDWGNSLSVRTTELRRTARRAIAGTADYVQVDSVAGFVRGTTVELVQENAGVVLRELKVLSSIDANRGLLVWNNRDPAVRLPGDAPLAIVNPARPLRVESVSYQLQVWSDGQPLRVYDDLACSPDHPRYGPAIVSGVAALFAANSLRTPEVLEAGRGDTADLVALGRRSRTGVVPEPVRLVELRETPRVEPVRLATPAMPVALSGGFDGLSRLTADDFIGQELLLDDSDEAIRASRFGIAALSEIDEISVVAVPDIHVQPRTVLHIPPPVCTPNPCLPGSDIGPPVIPIHVRIDDAPPLFSPAQVEHVCASLVSHCETRRDRIALLDPPFRAATSSALGTSAVRDFRARFDSSYAALYFPWIQVLDPLRGARDPVLSIPPCGHVAGQMAATDMRIGVHRAPANFPLLMAEATTFPIDETLHGLLNESGINAIRAIQGRAIRIAGARLVSSDTSWRFVNVRRLMLMIERSIEASIQWAIFEGNDWLTRLKLALCIDSFLRELWSRGALLGASPAEAYFVKCDDANNPADARARGELLIEIGVAPSVPFEFVILRIGRSANGFAITEAGEGEH